MTLSIINLANMLKFYCYILEDTYKENFMTFDIIDRYKKKNSEVNYCGLKVQLAQSEIVFFTNC